MGASFVELGEQGRLPLEVSGGPLQSVEYESPVASAQVKSALLLAGLVGGRSVLLTEPGRSRDHTERMLEAMNVPIETQDEWIVLRQTDGDRARQYLRPLDMIVPGDISSAAFPLIAASAVPHSRITVRNVGQNGTRTGLLDILARMGAQFSVENARITGGEPAADLTIPFDEMHGASISGELVVRAIDEFPIWAVAASQAASFAMRGPIWSRIRVRSILVVIVFSSSQ